MEDLWKKLDAVQIQVSAERSPCQTDRQYAEDLALQHADGDWKRFYRAIQALERGCGYPLIGEDLVTLCKKCAEQDSQKLLNSIEKKSAMLDTVLLLRSVSRAAKQKWLTTQAVSATPVLFEILRQILAEGTGTEETRSAVADGLCALLEASEERFQSLLQEEILYRPAEIPLMTELMAQLPEKGWAALGRCVSFSDPDPRHRKFWDQCADAQDWPALFQQARPFADAWKAYIADGMEAGQFGQSLSAGTTGLLTWILREQLRAPSDYIAALDAWVSAGETAMRRWFERESQQRGALVACLSQLELLRLVGLSRQPAVQVPEALRSRARTLIVQHRFLWDNPLFRNGIQREVARLQAWLESMARESELPAETPTGRRNGPDTI